jgi:hypothetical protein
MFERTPIAFFERQEDVTILGKNPLFLQYVNNYLQTARMPASEKGRCYTMVDKLWEKTVALNLTQVENRTASVGEIYPLNKLGLITGDDLPALCQYRKMSMAEKADCVIYHKKEYMCKSMLWNQPRKAKLVGADISQAECRRQVQELQDYCAKREQELQNYCAKREQELQNLQVQVKAMMDDLLSEFAEGAEGAEGL